MDLADDIIRNLLQPYGINATREFCSKVRSYVELLLRWNQKISLTTTTDPEEILRFHFGESIFATAAVPIAFGRLADVGTGAGFPGLPIKLVRPDIDVLLIESNLRKTVFLSEAVRVMAIDRVEVVRSRAEEISEATPPFDFITARAVGRHENLLSWASGRLSPAGRVLLWLGEEGAETISKNSGWNWADPLHIPGSNNRYILHGSKKP